MAVLFGMVIAKTLILQVWKIDSVPTYDLWLSEMAHTHYTWRHRVYNEDREGVFDKIWEPV